MYHNFIIYANHAIKNATQFRRFVGQFIIVPSSHAIY